MSKYDLGFTPFAQPMLAEVGDDKTPLVIVGFKIKRDLDGNTLVHYVSEELEHLPCYKVSLPSLKGGAL